jgi:hypothetical protein
MEKKLDLNKLRQSEFYDYARVSWMRGASMFKYVPSREALEESIAVHRLAEKTARRLLKEAKPGSEEAQELAYIATWLGNFAAWMLLAQFQQPFPKRFGSRVNGLGPALAGGGGDEVQVGLFVRANQVIGMRGVHLCG